MEKFLDISGVRNFKNIRAIALTAVLIALAVVGYGLLRIEPIIGVRVSFGFVFLATIAFLFGPAVAFPAGIIVNLLVFLIFPPAGASFNPLFDLNRGLAGILYASFLYRKNFNSEYFIIWVIAAKASVNFICHIIINTYLLIFMGIIHSDTINVITTIRIFRNILFLPVEILIMFTVIKFVALIAQQYNFIDPPKIIKKEVI